MNITHASCGAVRTLAALALTAAAGCGVGCQTFAQRQDFSEVVIAQRSVLPVTSGGSSDWAYPSDAAERERVASSTAEVITAILRAGKRGVAAGHRCFEAQSDAHAAESAGTTIAHQQAAVSESITGTLRTTGR